MDFGYDLSGVSTPIIKKYTVAASNVVLGVPYLKVADGGVGVILGALGGAADFVGVNIDAAGTFAAAQQSDNSDNEKVTSLIINPGAVFRARLSGGAVSGSALKERTVTTASLDGLTVTHADFDAATPSMDEGVIWGARGANSGKARKITSVSTTATTVILAFPQDINVGDTFFHAPIYPLRSITLQLTSDLTEIDAEAAIASDVEALVVEMILNDIAGNGDRESYAFIKFADHLLGGNVT